jgi:hypothetical protein
MMRRALLILSLAGLAVLASVSEIYPQVRDLPPAKLGKYASERSPHKFAGATRVVLDEFDPLDKDSKSALLQLDNNDVNFTEFGEQQITAVFYKPFQVKVTRRKGAGTEGKDPCVFDVELPKEQAVALGEGSLRIVTPVGTKSQPREVRLLLMNGKGQITNTLELRPAGKSSKSSSSSTSNAPRSERP